VNPYAAVSDFTVFGLPQTALGTVLTSTIQSQLDAAAGEVDAQLGARYPVPLAAPIPAIITQKTCQLAAYPLLSNSRGFNPLIPGDKAVYDNWVQAKTWLDDVKHQRAHLAGIAESGSNPVPQPVVISSSVVGLQSGATAPQRGW